MRRLRQFTVVATVTFLITALALVACSSSQGNAKDGQQSTSATDWKAVGQALGKEGAMQPGDVYKVSLPRSDLSGGIRL
jgi:preprotein translocase subunit SecG